MKVLKKKIENDVDIDARHYAWFSSNLVEVCDSYIKLKTI